MNQKFNHPQFPHGGTIWVDNDVIGYPPERHVVDYVEGNKIMFLDTKHPRGCKVNVAHTDLVSALAYAIYIGQQ